MTAQLGGVARHVYSWALRLAQPIYLLRLWWRGRAEPKYRYALAERFGRYAQPSSSGGVWVHAVSLGETRAAAALIESLRGRISGMRLLLTHGTATGRDAGAALLRPGDVQAWLPYDTPGSTRRFISQFRPAVGVLMETEIWPNVLHAAREAGVPMVLANARLSERSRLKGERFRSLLHPAMQGLSLVLAQTEADAGRLKASGAGPVWVCGNLKFDISPDVLQLAQGQAWKQGLKRPVLLFAISREGEEAMLLKAWTDWPGARPLLLIVPRHPQRFDEVAALVQSHGLSLARRSEWGDEPSADALNAQVWLGDSMREMPLYYGLSDVALLGGSFAPLGGQNLIEAAACGCPVVMGPHTFNFAEAAELAIEAGAAVRVPDMAHALIEATQMLDPATRRGISEKAVAFATLHRGAADRMAERIVTLMQR